MVKTHRENESAWYVWNTKTYKDAYIVKISEYNAFSKKKSRYRVDVGGVTIQSMIESFQTAKSVAFKAVK